MLAFSNCMGMVIVENSIMKSRVLYFDMLNIVASFGVVAMHFNGLTHSYSPTLDWIQAFFVDCLFYWAVPIFFMLSGATLLDYPEKYSTKQFFLKRFKRTVIPFLAWSLLALMWKVCTHQMTLPAGPRSLFDLVVNTKIIDVYWFFIPLFASYVSMPVLAEFRGKRWVLWYMVAVGLAFNIVLPFACAITGTPYGGSAAIPIVGGFIIYILLGYLLKDLKLSKRMRMVIYLLGFSGFAFRFLHTLLASYSEGALITTSWGVTNLPSFLEAIAVFVLFEQINWDRLVERFSKFESTAASIAGCSFGIYLIHMIVFWYGLQCTGLNGGDPEWRLIGPIVAYFVSLLFVAVMKRIPLVRKLVP